MLKLRQVSKAFDKAVYANLDQKLSQTKNVQSKFERQIGLYDDKLVIEVAQLQFEEMEETLEKLLTKVNTCQSLCEFYTFGNPPDYIFEIGEALGETTGLIP